MKALMTAEAIAAASVGAPSGAAEHAGESTASPRWQINRAGARPAITEARDGKSVDWLEKVSDAQYTTASAPAALPVASPSQGQALFGDIAPKFGQLTDDVLFGDVWARPGLSPRDRSLITVSALIAMNRPDQLRGHMARARGNGVSDAELIELTTHLAFYAGWPSAVTAIGVARDVFKTPHP